MLQTACVCSIRVCTQRDFSKSQILTVPSSAEVASCRPLGAKSMPESQPLWPSPDMISSVPLSDHIFHWPSSDAVATIGFDGCSASDETGPECAWYVFERPQRWTCGVA